MIASWMLYGMVVAALFGGAALVSERCLRMLRLPARWVWVVGLIAAISLPVVGIVAPEALPMRPSVTAGDSSSVGAGTSVWNIPGHVFIADDSKLAMLDRVIVLTWITSSLLLLVTFALSSWRLKGDLVKCHRSDVGGVTVLVSPTLGPAVVGLFGQVIVLPSWVLDKDRSTRRLIARHELEHLRRGDHRLLLAAFLIVLLVPWNLVFWFYLSRLRLAVESDCDIRLIKGGIDLRAYSNLLLDVGSRVGPAPAYALTFSRSRSSLFRRIQLMTLTPSRRFVPVALAVTASLTMAVLACETPIPVRPTDESPSAVVVAQSEELMADSITISLRPGGATVTASGEPSLAVNGEPEPLILIDGVVQVDFDLATMNPETIERVEVVKGEAAAALHGEAAAGGVINIFTKEQPDEVPANESGT